MNTATKTRTQRRMEKKQALVLLVLVLAISLASFTLGVVVGRRGAERDLAQKQQVADQILVTKIPQQRTAAPDTEPAVSTEESGGEQAAEEQTKLTFYDSLAKEETVPLGSGINLPPEEQTAAVKPPIDLPAEPIVKKQLPAVEVAKVEPAKVVESAAESLLVMPKSDPKGGYAVQVGSFASAEDAGNLRKKLIDKGYSAFVVEADLGAKGLWYRVRLGPYTDEADARSVQQLAEEKEQIKGFVSRQ